MSLAVAGLIAEGETTIGNAGAVNISFPSFWDMLEKISC
jgi:3-phosphoshikimate 1-carboxyvinyltransferase